MKKGMILLLCLLVGCSAQTEEMPAEEKLEISEIFHKEGQLQDMYYTNLLENRLANVLKEEWQSLHIVMDKEDDSAAYDFIIDESDSYLKKMDLNDVNRVNNFLRNTNIKLALFQLIRLLPNFTDEEILKIDELFNENRELYWDLIVKDRENNIEYFDIDRLKDILNGKDSALEEAVTKKKRFPWFRRNK